MHGFFSKKEEPPPAESRQDTELTLGPAMLLGLLLGLVLLCSLCFGLGYRMGSHSAQDSPAAGQQPGAPASSLAASSRSKPSATAQNIPQAPPQRAMVSVPPASGTNPAGNSQSPGPGSASGGNPNQWTVKPALPPTATAPAAVSGQPAPALKVQPATAPALALMVQIAAVSHQEDAEVLVSALRKRGYAVTVRRDLSDSLIHVQIGPFTSREEANNWRQKLLNDGYNAIVQP